VFTVKPFSQVYYKDCAKKVFTKKTDIYIKYGRSGFDNRRFRSTILSKNVYLCPEKTVTFTGLAFRMKLKIISQRCVEAIPNCSKCEETEKVVKKAVAKADEDV
jgi:hypothetical protein